MDDWELFSLLAGERTEPIRVCELPDPVFALIDTRVKTIMLSRYTVEKQQAKHVSDGHSIYQRAPTVIHHGHPRFESRKIVTFVLHDDLPNGRRDSIKAVVKSTKDGTRLFLVSIHKLDATSVRAIYRKTKSIEEWEFERREVGPPKNPT